MRKLENISRSGKNSILLIITFALFGCATASPKVTLDQVSAANTNRMTNDLTQPGKLDKEIEHSRSLFPDATNFPTTDDLNKSWQVPRLLTASKVLYPAYLRKSGEEGLVTVAMLIGEDGTIVDALVTKSTNIKLNQAAILSIYKWKFSPALFDNTPRKFVLIAPVLFQVSSDSGKSGLTTVIKG